MSLSLSVKIIFPYVQIAIGFVLCFVSYLNCSTPSPRPPPPYFPPFKQLPIYIVSSHLAAFLLSLTEKKIITNRRSESRLGRQRHIVLTSSCRNCLHRHRSEESIQQGRIHGIRCSETALGAPKHLYKRRRYGPTNGRTYGRTDQRTDRPSYRGAS